MVREAFTLYEHGYSHKQIANAFNQKGYKSPTGLRWQETTIHRMLDNEKYVGDVMMQKRVTLDPLTHREVKNDQTVYPSYYVPITGGIRTRESSTEKHGKRPGPCWTRASATEFPACTKRRRRRIFFMGRCSARGAVRPISAERFPEERQTALRFIIRCGTAGSVRRGRLETAAGMRRLRKRNCCAEYPMRSAGNGRERKNLARSDFCGRCRPFILKMEQ